MNGQGRRDDYFRTSLVYAKFQNKGSESYATICDNHWM